MKLELYVENGAPLLVFPQEMNPNKTMECYRENEGHSCASRAYLRSLKKPQTAEETRRAWQLLAHYAGLPGI